MSTLSDRLLAARRYQQIGQLADARRLCREILADEPQNLDALQLLTLIALSAGDYAAAETHCHAALCLSPDCLDNQLMLGLALRGQGKLAEAEVCLRRAVELDPSSAEAENNLGLVLQDQGQHEKAVECYRRALAQHPMFAIGHFNLGNALAVQDRIDEAISSFRRAVAIAPDYVDAHNNLGTVLQDQGDFDEALACYEHAIRLAPGCAIAHNNVGRVLREQGRLADSMLAYRGCLQLMPDLAEAHVSLGTLFLLSGDFGQGWADYEWRFRMKRAATRNLGLPRWSGEAVEGRTVLVWAEQGLGDTIQFVRYLKMVKERGARVVFECQKALVKLLGIAAGSGDPRRTFGADRLIAEGEALPEFDFQVPLLSLPGVFQTRLETIPAEVPYLFADEGLVEEWKEKLEQFKVQSSKFKVDQAGGTPQRALNPATGSRGPTEQRALLVGINWHGRAGKRESRQRDVPVEMFERLAGVPGVRMISLQKSEVEDQRSGEFRVQASKFKAEMEDRTQPSPSLALRACVEERTQPAIVDLGEIDTEHGAFMDTAAIMMNLDLVITSDTSVAHLAGALGVPVWVALPFVPDWRWLLDRSDSPWYPTMRLFRQRKIGDWAGVFEEIAAELRRVSS